MKLKQTLRDGAHTVKVYKDSDAGEYVVRIFPNGHVWERADCFESDLDSAVDTARAQLAWCVRRYGAVHAFAVAS